VLEPLESSPIARDMAFVSAALVGLVTFWRTVLIPLFTAAKKLGKIYEAVERLQSEFKPNGGSTLKDAIVRLESAITEIRFTQQISQARIKAIIADHACGYFEADKEGRWYWANRTTISLIGRPLGDLLGNGWINAVVQGDQDDVFARYRAAIEQSRDFECTVAFYADESQKSVIPVLVHAHPLRNEKNEVSGYFGVIKPMETNAQIK